MHPHPTPTTSHAYWEPLSRQLSALNAQHQYRCLPQYPSPLPANRDFSSNDYIGLSQHPKVIAAAQKAAQHYGAGSTGSRLLSGNRPAILTQLEDTIAHCKGTESALLFASGYQCNSSVLPAILDNAVWGTPVTVFADRLCHASIYSGLFSAKGVTLKRFRHNDMAHLNELLANHTRALQAPCWILTESVFSMDGDTAPLGEIQQLAEQYNAAVYVDEAHATGLLGQNGYGLTTEIDWGTVPAIAMGTFSKALGTQGAYIACPNIVKEWLINRCSGQIYSTALSPILAAAALAGWQLLPELNDQRQHLTRLSQTLRTGLTELGLTTVKGSSPIVPAIIGDTSAMLSIKSALEDNGLYVSGIRPPTVPPNTARLRFSVTIHHQGSDIAHVLDTIGRHTHSGLHP